MDSITSVRVPLNATSYQQQELYPRRLNGASSAELARAGYTESGSTRSQPQYLSDSAIGQEGVDDDLVKKSSQPFLSHHEQLNALISYARWVYVMLMLITVFAFVAAVCNVVIVVALNQDSKTLERMSVQGTQIMTTVQTMLDEFQQSNVLRTVHSFSASYDEISIKVVNSIVNTVALVDDVVQQVVKGNTTTLIREGLYEASLLIDTANHVLARFTTVFNISPHAIETISSGGD